MSRRRYLWLALLIVVAVGLRFYQLVKIPVSLYWDEVAMLVDAKVVSATGLDMHAHAWWQVLYPSYGDFKLPIYIWLASLSVKLLGVSEFAVRLPSALAGLFTIVTTGAIATQLFPKLSHFSKKKKELLPLSYFAMLIVALSPWSIMFSRTGFEGHVAQLFFALSIWILLKAKSTNPKLLWLSPLLGALATYTYFSVRFVWPVVFVTTLLLYFRKQAWKLIPLGLGVFAILLIPMIKSPLYKASNTFRYSTTSVLNAYDYPVISNKYREIAGNKPWDRLFFHRHLLMLKELAANYSDHLSLKYIFLKGDPNLRHGTGEHGLFLLIFLPIFLVGLYKMAKKYPAELLLLVVWWLAALLPASVPETTPHALRSLNALVPLSLIISFGLFQIVAQKKRWLNWTLGVLIMLSVLEFSMTYFLIYPAKSASSWQDSYKQMALEINQALPHVADVYIGNFDDRFYLWLLAYGDYTPTQIQNIKKENYQVKAMNKITFHMYRWSKINSLDRKILIVGSRADINSKLKEYGITPIYKKDIYQANGTALFTVVMLDRPSS